MALPKESSADTASAPPPRAFRVFDRAAIDQTIDRRFEEQVTADPDRLAVQFGRDSLTYHQLNEAANRIAHALLARRGSGPEPVALAIDQGWRLIAAILGVLKAGKFYVPLEPSHPPERLGSMLRDSRAGIVLASPPAVSLLRRLAGLKLHVVDVERVDASWPVANPRLAGSPDDHAYIYYTTGSTGEPKGVVDSHSNVLHNVMRYTNGLGITPDDRLTLLQSPSFSGAVSSLFTAILNGAASCPFDLTGSTSQTLADYVDHARITVYHSVPAVFRSFLRGNRVFSSVRIVRLEGDQATLADLELFRQHFPRTSVLVNGLGATETGIVRQFFVGHDTPVTLDPLPIGHPVTDMEVSVLDDQGQPAPPGTTGEIAVRGEHLAVGYWNRPEMTARAFRVDPDRPARRLYRTGDLGRMTADGCLQHLGRKDALIKIRGLTVATAEVEAALCRLPTIQAAVVVAKPDRRGAPRLMAYFVPRPGASVTVTAIRRQLTALLAPQMIPSAYVALPHLPLNENRKLDRRALPDRPRDRPSLDHPYVAPRYPAEMQLVHAWEALLEVAPIGIRDDFLDLGGDSLLAAAMIASVEDLTGVPLSPSTLTTEATIEQLAQRLSGCRREEAPIVGVHLDGPKPPFYFLHGDYVHGGLFCRQISHHLGPDQPCLLVTPCGLDGHPPPGAIEDMAEQHLRAVRARQPHGPYQLGGNCNGGLVALEMARRLTESGERVHRLIVFRASARNIRFAPLRQWVAPAGALLRLPAPRRRALIRHLRWFLEAWAPLPATGRAWLLLRKAGGLLRPRWGNDRHASGRSLQARAGRLTLDDLTRTYMDAVADYIPMPYDGNITLLWPEQEAELESAADALFWWRRVSPHTVLDVVPGDHLTALTVHASAFAQRLQTWLAFMPAEAPEAGAARPDDLWPPAPDRRDQESTGVQTVPSQPGRLHQTPEMT